MPSLTDRCYGCGAEYAPLIADDGHCPDCDSPATPLVGSPIVFDVRPTATIDLDTLPVDDATEVLVRDDTDRLIAYAFAVPTSGRPYAVAITFDDATIRRGDEHWSAIDGPVCVADAISERLGARPGSPPEAPE